MLTALATPQSVLVLGATSDIATAVLDRLARDAPLERIVLAGRAGAHRDAEVARAGALTTPTGRVEVVDFDALSPEDSGPALEAVFDAGDIDVVILAFGVLPSESDAHDPAAAAAAATVNFTGAVYALTLVGERTRRQGHGTVVVLSSVAGERPRRSNYLYGATKAGLDAFATGLGDALHGTGVSVLVVRPGFVHTKMTSGMAPAPLSVRPEAVADAVVGHLGRGSRTLWVPRTMRPVMSLLRHLPRPVFRRLPI